MMRAQLKRKLIVTLALPAIGLSASAVLAAGDADKMAPRSTIENPPAATTQSGMHHNMNDVRASELIGMKVHNAQGENLGKIDDLVVDVNNERVHYAVLAFGGALGLGEKLFAYPVSLFSEDTADKKLVLNVDKEKLKKAPGFERSHWPDWNRDRYSRDVEGYFGPTVAAKAMPNQRLARASELIGKDINDRNGKDVGEIKDLVVNLSNNKVHYAVIELDRGWTKADKLLPVSLKSFQFPAEHRKDLVINTTRDQLDMSRGFAKNEWPNIADPAYQRDIDGYLGQRGVAGEPGPVMKQ